MLNKIDDLVHTIIDKYIIMIGFILLIVISFIIRLHLSPICVLSADYNNFLVPWVEYYKEYGFAGLSQKIGDYYVPYNLFLLLISYLPFKPWVMISAFSVICDYLSAVFIYKISMILLSELNRNDSDIKIKALFACILSLLLPFTFLNSALWKQCDGIYVCCLILSLYYVLKNKGRSALIWFTVAFVFKMQALFLFPLYVMLYILRESNIRLGDFLIIPLGYLIAGLPAVLAGRRFTNVYGTYLKQMTNDGYNAMTINFPNIYSFGLGDYPALSKPAVLLTMGILIGFVCFILKKNQNYKISKSHIIYLALWCIWTCTMFLPAMHERYNYAVIMLSSVYFIITNKRKLWIPVLLNLIAIVLYSSSLFGVLAIPHSVMAVMHISAYLYVTYDLSLQISLNKGASVEKILEKL